MITINKGASNTMYVTATEKVTITNPFFLISFKHMVSGGIRTFLVSDTSTHTERYNEFTFTEGATTQKTLPVGEYEYTIYAQTSSNNTNPALANEVVEEGIAVVKDTENTFAVNTITKEYKVNAITQ